MARIRPLVFTALNSAALILLGLVVSQKSPSFNDLILIADTDVAGGSFFVLASNTGYMVGSFLAGALYRRIQTKSLTIGVAMLLAGIFTALTPWCNVFGAMVAVHAMVSILNAVYETTINTEEVQAWDGSSQAAMQFLSFSYSFGGVFGPLITRPFLAPKRKALNSNDTSSNNATATTFATSMLDVANAPVPGSPAIHSAVMCPETAINCTDGGSDQVYNLSATLSPLNNSLASQDVETRLHYAYLITGSASVAVSVAFFLACFATRSKRWVPSRRQEEKKTPTRTIPRKSYFALMTMICVFFFFHNMAIDAWGTYRFYFVVTHLDWSKQTGAILISMYWGLAMAMKFVLIGVYKCLKPGIVLTFSLSAIVVGMTLFTIAGYYRVHILIWVGTAIFAIAQASVFGGSYSWTDGNLVKVDGKESSAFMISASLGALASPVPVGFLMKNWTHMAYPYFVLCQVSISTTLFLLMNFVVKRYMDSKYGPLRSSVGSSNSTENADELMVQNKSMNEKSDAKVHDPET